MTVDTMGRILTSAWTLWAILLFCGIAFWAWRPANRRRFDEAARIPLNDDR